MTIRNVIAATVPGAISTARLAFASSAFTLVVAVLATVLGPPADYEGRKKRFFAAFFGLGVVAVFTVPAIAGPLMVGVFTQVTGDSSIGVQSIAALFVVGGILLTRVPAAARP